VRSRRGRLLPATEQKHGWGWNGWQELRECVGLGVLLQNKLSGGIRRCAGGRGRR
jgi:hypothetical protein